MVKRYTTEDVRVFEEAPGAVYGALADLESWNKWWPKGVRFRVVQLTAALKGTKLEVLPWGRSFFAEVDFVEPGAGLGFAYRAGPYRGAGTWKLEAEDEHTRVAYRSDLTVHPSLIAEHFLNAKDFSTRHTRFMRSVFDGLAWWLNRERA